MHFLEESRDLLEMATDYLQQLSSILDISTEETSEGELAAMVSFAIAFPAGFMALVDTYDVKRYLAYRQISLGIPSLSSFSINMSSLFHQVFSPCCFLV